MPTVSPAQHRLMEAAAHSPGGYGGVPRSVGEEFVGKDAKIAAAGIAFVTGDGKILLLRRAGGGDHPGTWGLPGGRIEDGETADNAARRESFEEIGKLPFWSIGPIDRRVSADGVDFTTFAQRVDEFEPVLNDEHDAYQWAKLGELPDGLHPGLNAMLAPIEAPAQDQALAFDRMIDLPAGDRIPADRVGLAFDRVQSSVREYDRDGRLHVGAAHISKANVCPYFGREIPRWKDLGLSPDKLYHLLRDPEELRKAAPTFNNIPVLSKHVPVSAFDHQPGYVVGSTGTDATFNDPYLDNSMVVWARDEIEAIEADEKRQLSSAYHYRADMQPGVFKGVKYDGVMRDIVGNHVALVNEGRAGDDVVVGDSKEGMHMSQTVLSRQAVAVQGALAVYLRPKLAQDAKIDLSSILAKVTKKNFASNRTAIADDLRKATAGKLAQDASINDVVDLLDTLASEEAAEVAEGQDVDPNSGLPVVGKGPKEEETKPAIDADRVMEFCKGKMGADDFAQLEGLLNGGAQDEEDEEDRKKREAAERQPPAKDNDTVSKPAMDAALKRVATETEAKVVARMNAIREAEREVRPYVGDIGGIAFDSADAVYAHALEALGVEGVKEIHPSAYRQMLKRMPEPGARKAPETPSLGMDAASVSSFQAKFPGAAKVRLV